MSDDPLMAHDLLMAEIYLRNHAQAQDWPRLAEVALVVARAREELIELRKQIADRDAEIAAILGDLGGE